MAEVLHELEIQLQFHHVLNFPFWIWHVESHGDPSGTWLFAFHPMYCIFQKLFAHGSSAYPLLTRKMNLEKGGNGCFFAARCHKDKEWVSEWASEWVSDAQVTWIINVVILQGCMPPGDLQASLCTYCSTDYNIFILYLGVLENYSQQINFV